MTTTTDSIGFAPEELFVLGGLFDRAFPGVGDPIPEISAEARDAGLSVAGRCLLARGVVERLAEDEGLRVVSPFDALFDVIFAPALLVHACRFAADHTELRLFHVRPELGVEQIEIDGLFYLTPFNSDELVERVGAFADLAPRESTTQADGFTTTAGALELLEESIRSGGPPPGSIPGDGDPFLTALEDAWPDVISFSIACLSGNAGVLSGGQLGWINTGKGGLWQTEALSSTEEAILDTSRSLTPDVEVRVTSVTPEELVKEFLGYLPAAETTAI